MKAGSAFEIELIDTDGKPLRMANLSVDVLLYVNGRQRYRFDAGSTDLEGHLSSSYEALERTVGEGRALFAKEYDTPIGQCDETLGFAVPTFAQLGERVESARRWFPDDVPALEARVKKSANRTFGFAGVKKVSPNGTRIKVELPVERT